MVTFIKTIVCLVFFIKNPSENLISRRCFASPKKHSNSTHPCCEKQKKRSSWFTILIEWNPMFVSKKAEQTFGYRSYSHFCISTRNLRFCSIIRISLTIEPAKLINLMQFQFFNHYIFHSIYFEPYYYI